MSQLQTPSIETVWLDLTPLVRSKSNQLTGIPRTILKILGCWRERGFSNLRFCYLDTTGKRLVEITPEAILAKFSAKPPAVVNVPTSGIAQPRPTSWKEAIRWRLLRWMSWLPTHVEEKLVSVIRPVWRLCLRTVPAMLSGIKGLMTGTLTRVSETARGMLSRNAKKRDGTSLTSRDLLISLGGGWVVEDASEVLWDLQQQQGFRLATLLYDMIPLEFPQFFGAELSGHFRNWNANTVWASDVLLTISQHSRQDILKFCAASNLPSKPIEVLRLGEDFDTTGPELAPPPNVVKPGEPFILTVGTVEVRKNHVLLYHVWRQLVERLGPDAPKLIIVGATGWLVQDLLYQIATDPVVRERIVLLPRCPDTQLRWLYQRCLFTVYPSHYEGWGLPIAESLAFGKYCISSSSSSMPEVGGDLVGRHAPHDAAGCIEKILEAMNPAFRQQMETRIRNEYRPCRWATCAEQLQTVLESYFGPIFREDLVHESATSASTRHLPHSAEHSRRSA
jgi:hypothetical protein